jgi:hypothetical protein
LADYQYIRILKNEIKRGLSSMQWKNQED